MRIFNGPMLKRLRLKKNMRQIDLAKVSGISQETISLLERGKHQNPETETILRLSHGLGITPNELLGIT